MNQSQTKVRKAHAAGLGKLGPSLMLLGLALGVTALVEALELLPGIDWGRSFNLALGVLAMAVYLGGYLLDVALARAIEARHAPGRPHQSALLERHYAQWRRAAGFARFVFLAVSFVGLKWHILGSDPGNFFPDTLSYVQVAQADLFSAEFLAGQRPFIYPLLHKVLGVTPSNFKETEVLERVATWQFVLSTAAWLLLGWGLTVAMKNRRVRLLAFAAVLGFGLNLHVSQWDSLMISESVSTSFFAAGLGWSLLGISQAAVIGRGSVMRRLAYFFILCLLLTGFSFTRDSNVVLIATASAGIVLYGWFSRGHGAWWPRWLLITGGTLALVCLLQLRSIEVGGRWQVPFYHVMRDRILFDAEAREYFTQRGLPEGEPLQVLLTLDRNGFVYSLQDIQRYEHIRQWIHEHGRSTYVAFLLRRPVDLLTTPLHQRASLLNPLSTEYRNREAVTPTWLHLLTAFAFPRSTLVLGVVFAACLVAMIHVTRQQGLSARWAQPLFLVATSYGLMQVAWFGDSVEIERHAYQAAMQLRLGLLLMMIFALDKETELILPRLARRLST